MAGADELRVAVVGASSVPGSEIVELLTERGFPVGELRLLGSERTAGKTLEMEGTKGVVGLLAPDAFADVDLAFFTAGPTVSGAWAPVAVDAGAAVIDGSSRFRLDPEVPLVVPEVNRDAIAEHRQRGIVASPSATTIGLAVALAPLHQAAGLRRVTVSTYQGVASAGRRALNALSRETIDLLNSRGRTKSHFPRPLAFNSLPQVGALEPGGSTTHELHVVEELRRVLDAPGLGIHVTAVRVPTFFGSGMSVGIECESPLDAAAAAELLRRAPGIFLHEGDDAYPTPHEIVGSEATHVGRVRDDPTADNALSLWIALDSVRKGAALNAVQIAEILVRDHL